MADKGRVMGAFSLIASRVVYAANWYNLSPAIPGIEKSFGVGLPSTVYIFTFFLLGAGIFQVPAGVLSSRIGAKTTALMGMVLMGFSDLISIYTPNYGVFLGFRFINGVGAAMFFSTAMAVLSDLYRERVTDIVVIYNVAFNIGAGLGVTAFAFIIQFYSWQMDQVIIGILSLAVGLSIWPMVNRSEEYTSLSFPEIKRRIVDMRTWLLAIGFSGFWASTYLAPEYLKEFSLTVGFGGAESAILGGLILFIGILGIPLVGAFRLRNTIKSAVYLTVLLGLMLVALPFAGFYGIWVETFILGTLFVSVSAMEYSVVISRELSGKYKALSLGLFNSIQILIGSIISYAFSNALNYGFTYAWIMMGFVAMIMLPLALLDPEGAKETMVQTVNS
ncbi:MAG: MFS transporter [Candidatus Thermoplasmatota archaeon]|jgi:MFS family permease|nr:MFS transporter [Candidatus Thermoplasmatota archaeon]MCL5794543.1 MFS transporter [Candidatus Thermoplasmatota archaeon]